MVMKVFREYGDGTIEQIGCGKYYYIDYVGDIFITSRGE
jgi:hypothetical protein